MSAINDGGLVVIRGENLGAAYEKYLKGLKCVYDRIKIPLLRAGSIANECRRSVILAEFVMVSPTREQVRKSYQILTPGTRMQSILRLCGGDALPRILVIDQFSEVHKGRMIWQPSHNLDKFKTQGSGNIIISP